MCFQSVGPHARCPQGKNGFYSRVARSELGAGLAAVPALASPSSGPAPGPGSGWPLARGHDGSRAPAPREPGVARASPPSASQRDQDMSAHHFSLKEKLF